MSPAEGKSHQECREGVTEQYVLAQLLRYGSGGPDTTALLRYIERMQGPGPVSGFSSEDVLNKALLKVYQSWQKNPGSIPKEAKLFTHWIYKVVRNCCLDFKRKSGRIQKFELSSSDEAQYSRRSDSRSPRPEDVAEYHETKDQIEKILTCLPEEKREVFIAVIFGGMKYEEASGRYDVKMGTLKSGLHKLRKRIEAALQ